MQCILIALAFFLCTPLLAYEYDEVVYDDAYFNLTGTYESYGYTQYYRATEESTFTWSSKIEDIDSCPNGQCSTPDVQDNYSVEYNPSYYWDNCVLEDDLRVLVNGTDSCDLVIVGADNAADRLEGGLDGTYKLVSCYDGKPMYRRVTEPLEENRVLWYNIYYGDWEFSTGDEPSEDLLVMYGDFGWVSPLEVPNWHLAASLNKEQASQMESEGEDLYYIVPEVKISCWNAAA